MSNLLLLLELFGTESWAGNEESYSPWKDVLLEQDDMGRKGKFGWETTTLPENN